MYVDFAVVCLYIDRGLVNIMNCESEEELEHLALSFTASRSHFGSVKTIELDQGGTNKRVTLANRHDFVQKLYSWHLTGKQLNIYTAIAIAHDS